MTITKEQALRFINSRILIAAVGKYIVKVTSVVPFLRPDGTLTQIVNFAAMTPYHQSEAKRLAKEGDYNGASNQNLSANLLPGMYIPAKGEIVDIEVGNVTTKNGVNGLFVTSVTQRQAIAGASLKGFTFDDDEDVDFTEAEVISDAETASEAPVNAEEQPELV